MFGVSWAPSTQKSVCDGSRGLSASETSKVMMKIIGGDSRDDNVFFVFIITSTSHLSLLSIVSYLFLGKKNIQENSNSIFVLLLLRL